MGVFHILGSSSQNGSALRRDFSVGNYGSTKRQMTSPSDGSLSSGGGMDCGGDAPLSQFDREVSITETCRTALNVSCLFFSFIFSRSSN